MKAYKIYFSAFLKNGFNGSVDVLRRAENLLPCVELGEYPSAEDLEDWEEKVCHDITKTIVEEFGKSSDGSIGVVTERVEELTYVVLRPFKTMKRAAKCAEMVGGKIIETFDGYFVVGPEIVDVSGKRRQMVWGSYRSCAWFDELPDNLQNNIKVYS